MTENKELKLKQLDLNLDDFKSWCEKGIKYLSLGIMLLKFLSEFADKARDK